MPAGRAFPTSSGSPPLFSASSTASGYTFVFFREATRSTFPYRSSSPLFRSIQAILVSISFIRIFLHLEYCIICASVRSVAAASLRKLRLIDWCQHPMASADFLRFVVTMLRFEFVYSLAPARPPRVSVITFTSYIRCIYALNFGQYRTLFCLANSSFSKRLLCSFC